VTRVTWIRHGEPSRQALGTHYGQVDVDLSDVGRDQSHAVAERLAATTFDAVWSSDLRRARFVADLLVESRGLVVNIDAALRERHLGVFHGMTYAAADAANPEAARRLRAEGEVYRVPGGENMADLVARVIPVIDAIVAAHRDQSVVIAGHGGPIRAVIGQALGIPLANLNRLRIGYCSVSVVEYRDDGSARVLCING
jgi:broad specificity phosphatase PhoE